VENTHKKKIARRSEVVQTALDPKIALQRMIECSDLSALCRHLQAQVSKARDESE